MRDALAEIALRIGLFRFTLAPLQPLEVPAVNKGNMLRGGFGHAFRRLCCIPQCKDARACPLDGSCPYKAVFEPSPPPGADRLSKNQDIPRPFVFRPPLDVPPDVAPGFSLAADVTPGLSPARAALKGGATRTRYQPGERFEFGLVLIGRALDSLPYFVLSFRELAAEGLGLNRAKCTLERVEEVCVSSQGEACDDPKLKRDSGLGTQAPVSLKGAAGNGTKFIYSAEDQMFRSPTPSPASDYVRARLQDLAPDTRHLAPALLTVRFLTPTHLTFEGQIVKRPEFHHLFKRVRDRVNALSSFYGDGPVDADFKGLGERAEKVRTVASRIEWVERFRTSSKTHQRHELSGFVGECTYDLSPVPPSLSPESGISNFESGTSNPESGTSNFESGFESGISNLELLEWLICGELLHVGKHAAWGNGWYELAKAEE